MSDEQKPHPTNDASNPVIPVSGTSEYVDEVVDEQESSKKQNNCNKAVEYKHPNITVNPDHKDSFSTPTNIIAICAVLINLFLAIYTYQLFQQTKKSTNAAILSAESAQDALKDSREQNAKNDLDKIKRDEQERITRIYEDSIRKDERDTSREKDRKTYELLKRSTDAQIRSITDAKTLQEAQERIEAQELCSELEGYEPEFNKWAMLADGQENNDKMFIFEFVQRVFPTFEKAGKNKFLRKNKALSDMWEDCRIMHSQLQESAHYDGGSAWNFNYQPLYKLLFKYLKSVRKEICNKRL